jgi:hypothetical protein
MIGALLDFLVGQDERKALDDATNQVFNHLLDVEFLHHLECARVLTSMRPEERTHEQEFLLKTLRDTYRRDGDCPSGYYSRAAPHLQRRYWAIHSHICDALDN